MGRGNHLKKDGKDGSGYDYGLNEYKKANQLFYRKLMDYEIKALK